MFAESWTCSISRYWFDGPKKARPRCVIDNLPGYPDNINRASRRQLLAGAARHARPALDLALQHAGFRKRMARASRRDQWLYPEHQHRLRREVQREGRDPRRPVGSSAAVNHPMITSMREHRGWLYLGGVSNNRIGRYRLPGADPELVRARTPPIGEPGRDRRLERRPAGQLFVASSLTGSTVPPMDGPLRPEYAARRGAACCSRSPRSTNLIAAERADVRSVGSEQFAAARTAARWRSCRGTPDIVADGRSRPRLRRPPALAVGRARAC